MKFIGSLIPQFFRRVTSPSPSADSIGCSRATTPTTDPDGRRQGHGRAVDAAPIAIIAGRPETSIMELVDCANQMTDIIAGVRAEFMLLDAATDWRATPPTYNDLARTLAAIRTQVGA